MTTACTRCRSDIGAVLHARWDYSVENGDTIAFDCPVCGASLRARVYVDHDYRILEPPRAAREREKYARRMRGDWS